MKQGLPGVPSVAKWLSSTLSPGDKVGLDPKLMSVSEARYEGRRGCPSAHRLVSQRLRVVMSLCMWVWVWVCSR